MLDAARSPILRLPVLLVLFTSAAFREALRASAFSSDNLWWHLRIGTWVLQNHAIPRWGLYSQLSSLPWVDHNWPYEALLALAYSLMGMRAVPLLLMIFKVVLAGVTFFLAGGRKRFWIAVLLSALVQFVLIDLQPLPVFFSMCFLAIALHCLIESRCRRDLKPIVWLPLLFWFWVNLDAQFLLGWLLLVIFLLAEAAERILEATGRWHFDSTQRVPFLHLLGIALASIAVVLLSPYSIRSVPAAFQSVYSPTLFKNFAFMMAMNFREPAHFVVLLLVLLACVGLGRQRSHDIFKILLLAGWSVLAFRIQNDSWTVLICAVAILATATPAEELGGAQVNFAGARKNVPLLAGVIVLLVVAYHCLPTNAEMEARLANVMPVKACNYIRTNHLPAPIFNEYRWAGFVMWELPEYPVAIDERFALYGEEVADRYFDVVMGKQRMETLASFAGARTILLPAEFGMTKALTTIPELKEQFREVYRDELAVVLVRQ